MKMKQIMVEGDSLCAICWALDKCIAPWYLADMVNKVGGLSWHLQASLHHVKRRVNSTTDRLAKEGVSVPL